MQIRQATSPTGRQVRYRCDPQGSMPDYRFRETAVPSGPVARCLYQLRSIRHRDTWLTGTTSRRLITTMATIKSSASSFVIWTSSTAWLRESFRLKICETFPKTSRAWRPMVVRRVFLSRISLWRWTTFLPRIRSAHKRNQLSKPGTATLLRTPWPAPVFTPAKSFSQPG